MIKEQEIEMIKAWVEQGEPIALFVVKNLLNEIERLNKIESEYKRLCDQVTETCKIYGEPRLTIKNHI